MKDDPEYQRDSGWESPVGDDVTYSRPSQAGFPLG